MPKGFFRKYAVGANSAKEAVRPSEGAKPRQSKREGNFSLHKWPTKWTTGKMSSKIGNKSR